MKLGVNIYRIVTELVTRGEGARTQHESFADQNQNGSPLKKLKSHEVRNEAPRLMGGATSTR